MGQCRPRDKKATFMTAQYELDTEAEAQQESGESIITKQNKPRRSASPIAATGNPPGGWPSHRPSPPAAACTASVAEGRAGSEALLSSQDSVRLRGWTMDLGTENRLAALLLEEAQRLRVQAEKEGVHAYLQKPNVRHRPNSRFLAATVLGVQQANRVVEVNEMWRAREKELELESKMKSGNNGRVDSRSQKRKGDSRDQSPVSKIEQDRPHAASCSSRDSHSSSCSDRADGLCDDEIEAFLRSRVKRGRGAIGSRMDEPGPYLKPLSGRQENSTSPDAAVKEERKRRVYGPEKPLFLSSKSSDEELSTSKHKHREERKTSSSHRGRNENRRFKDHHREHKSRSRE